MPFLFLFLLFLVPALEVSVLMRVSDALGGWNTFALVILTAAVGVSLVRSQGVATLMSVQRKLATGEMPGQEIVEGMMLALAGILLFIPGFITDFIGLLLLTPFTRAPIAAFTLKRLQLRVVSSRFGQNGQGPFANGPFGQQGQDPFQSSEHSSKDGDIIDGEYERKPDEVKPESRLHDGDKSSDKDEDDNEQSKR